MWEFFTIIDENHDDPTLFPVLSGPQFRLPIEWEDGDGEVPTALRIKRVTISQHTGKGWTKVRTLSDANFDVIMTEQRLIVFCEKFTKGGGWWGFGVGGLAVALVANAVSHARAAARRKGKLLCAHVRYPWVAQVAVTRDNRGRPVSLRTVVDAGAPGQPRLLALDLALGRNNSPEAYAVFMARLVAARRLKSNAVPPEEVDSWRRLADLPNTVPDDATWNMPSYIQVGAAGSLPTGTTALLPAAAHALAPTATPELPETPSVPALEAPSINERPSPASSDAQCRGCGREIRAHFPSCSYCGYPIDRSDQVGSAFT